MAQTALEYVRSLTPEELDALKQVLAEYRKEMSQNSCDSGKIKVSKTMESL